MNSLDSLPNCEPHDEHPHKPLFTLPANACDVHAHVCGPRDRFALTDNRLYNPPEASVSQYLHMLDGLGLARGVLVQPSVYGTDNSALLEGLAFNPLRLRGVAVVAFDVAEGTLSQLHAQGVRGVRCNIVDLQNGKGQLPIAGLTQLAHRIKDMGWHIEFLMHVNEFPYIAEQLAHLPVPMVFGHLGYVPATQGPNDGFEGLLRLASDGKAWIKLTAPYRLTLEQFPYPSTLAAMHRLVKEVPDRLMWGSDWPHVFIKSDMPNDGDLINQFLDVVGNTALLQTLLVSNPAKVYDF